MKKVLVISIVLITIIFFAKSCSDSNQNRRLRNQVSVQKQENVADEEEIQKLKKHLKEANKNLIELEQEANEFIEDNNYLNIKFPSDGNYYKEAFDSVTFYSDPTCTEKLDDARFMSPEIDSAQAENGLNILCLRLDNGEICYCTDSPYLITEGKYNEMKEEE